MYEPVVVLSSFILNVSVEFRHLLSNKEYKDILRIANSGGKDADTKLVLLSNYLIGNKIDLSEMTKTLVEYHEEIPFFISPPWREWEALSIHQLGEVIWQSDGYCISEFGLYYEEILFVLDNPKEVRPYSNYALDTSHGGHYRFGSWVSNKGKC